MHLGGGRGCLRGGSRGRLSGARRRSGGQTVSTWCQSRGSPTTSGDQSSQKRPASVGTGHLPPVGPGSHRELFLGALGFKLDLEKAEEPEIKLPTFTGS